MSGTLTFAMIKPDAIAAGAEGNIIKMITDAGFRIAAIKLKRMNRSNVENFYAVHKGKPFYEPLIDFMISGPVIPMVLEKENAVEDFRKLIGATDFTKAEEGTIRKLYASSIKENAIHGSDSDENALKEAHFHFSSCEMFQSDGNCFF